MSKKPKYDLQTMAERFARMLLSEATQGKIGGTIDPSVEPSKIDFKDRRALLDTITKLIREKNAKEPEGDTSSFGDFKEMLNGDGGEDGSRGDTPPAALGVNGHAPDSDDDLSALT